MSEKRSRRDVAVYEAVTLLAGPCHTSKAERCWGDPTRYADTPWSADRWCTACIAQAGLDGRPLRKMRPAVTDAVREAVESGDFRALAVAAIEAVRMLNGGYRPRIDVPGEDDPFADPPEPPGAVQPREDQQ